MTPSNPDNANPQGSLHAVARPLRGLERVCKAYGRMKCGDVVMVWDYANDVAAPEKEMKPGSPRWCASENAKWSSSDLRHRADSETSQSKEMIDEK